MATVASTSLPFNSNSSPLLLKVLSLTRMANIYAQPMSHSFPDPLFSSSKLVPILGSGVKKGCVSPVSPSHYVPEPSMSDRINLIPAAPPACFVPSFNVFETDSCIFAITQRVFSRWPTRHRVHFPANFAKQKPPPSSRCHLQTIISWRFGI